MKKFAEVTYAVLTGCTAVGVIAAVLAVPVMALVNYVVAPQFLLMVFGTVKLGFWKALCLNLLCGVLFQSSVGSKK